MEKAFTLIELLVVIAIIGILAAIAFTLIGSSEGQKARDAKRVSDLTNLTRALELYKTGNFRGTVPGYQKSTYPDSLGDLVTAGLIAQVPLDPRDNDAGGATCGTVGSPFNPGVGYDNNDYGYRYEAYPAACGDTCQAYVLSACLERGENDILSSDCDSATNPSCFDDCDGNPGGGCSAPNPNILDFHS